MEESVKHENIKELLENLPKVENMKSSRGNDIPNQFIIRGDGWVLFQSYNSPIALYIRETMKTYIFPNWDYSVTTGKYRNQFLGEDKAETLRKLKNGTYTAVGFEVE